MILVKADITSLSGLSNNFKVTAVATSLGVSTVLSDPTVGDPTAGDPTAGDTAVGVPTCIAEMVEKQPRLKSKMVEKQRRLFTIVSCMKY